MKTMRLFLALAILAALPAARAQTQITLEGSNTFGKDLGPKLAAAFESRDGQRVLAPLGFVPRIHIPFEREGLAL